MPAAAAADGVAAVSAMACSPPTAATCTADGLRDGLRRHQLLPRLSPGTVINMKKKIAFAGSIVVALLATTSVTLSWVAITLAEALEEKP